jgi:hypothetical protein
MLQYHDVTIGDKKNDEKIIGIFVEHADDCIDDDHNQTRKF